MRNYLVSFLLLLLELLEVFKYQKASSSHFSISIFLDTLK